jgi:glycosyltransferase involved in cell wall biosynthesis
LSDNNFKIVCVRLGAAPYKVGGGMKRFIEISKRWKKDADIYVLMHKQTFEWLKELGLDAKPFYLLNSKSFHEIFSPISGMIRFFMAKNSSFNCSYINVVCSLSHYLFDVIPSIKLKKMFKAKLVVYIHHLVPFSRKQSFIQNLLAYLQQLISLFLIKRYSDIVFVLNRITKEKLVNIGIPEKKIFVSFNGVDLDFIKKSIEGIDKKEFEGCFLGRLTPLKGVFDLIEIWKVVCECLPNAKLVIIGTGDDGCVTKLKNKINEWGLSENVFLLGYVREEEKYQLLKKSRVFLFPSHEEGWGLAVLEGMACGLPIVVYDIPPFREIYGETINLVKFKDIKKFGYTVIEILKDNKLQNSLSTKSINLAHKFNWKDIAIRELQIIKEMRVA